MSKLIPLNLKAATMDTCVNISTQELWSLSYHQTFIRLTRRKTAYSQF
jgi:hypothetical protein